MTPAIYLYSVLGILYLAILIEIFRMRIHRSALRRLARQWNMHFSKSDRLRLASRICHLLPTPGGADVRVHDLIFRTERNHHQYLFTIEYTVGTIRGKLGRSRVAGFDEPISRRITTAPARRTWSSPPET